MKPAVVTGLRTRQLNWTSVVVSWMPPAPDKQLLVELELTTDAGIHDKRWEVGLLHGMRHSSILNTLDVMVFRLITVQRPRFLWVIQNCQHYQKRTQSTIFCDLLPEEYLVNVDF